MAHPAFTAYISNRRLLLNLADSGGRVMYAYKDLVELAGLTSRLYTLLSTLLNLPKGYEPIKVERGNAIQFRGVDVRIPRVSKAKEGDEKKPVTNFIHHKKGEAENGWDGRDAPLVKDLNMVIERGDHTMITGINGVGKTAVARVLAGLWDPVNTGSEGGGQVDMPKDDAETEAFFLSPVKPGSSRPRSRHRPTIYVLPQRAYMPVGSLLEQIIYPCSYATFVKMTSGPVNLPRRTSSLLSLPSLNRTTSAADVLATAPSPSREAIEEIHEILEKVHLGYLIGREGGLHVRKEWRDVLSGGEKQRMGMARVLWWRPKWAVLDGGIFFWVRFVVWSNNPYFFVL
jgi:ATP-binding cassette subfamily D (ALD) long-chain fatty acid import protein